MKSLERAATVRSANDSELPPTSVPHFQHRAAFAPTPSGLPDWSRRIPTLDGLRGLAILLVLLGHGVFQMETQSRLLARLLALGRLSWSGVDLFFVLSGLLIGGILIDARESPRYFATFYIRRAYRILPLYSAITMLFLIHHLPFALLPRSLNGSSPLTIPWLSYLTLTQNFWMVQLGWFGPPAMAVTWSLAVEEQFYLTVPWLIRFMRRKMLVFVMISVVITAPALRVVLHRHLQHGDFACYVLMPCRADALCLGVLVALMVRSQNGWIVSQRRKGTLYGLTALLVGGIVLMLFKGWVVNSAPPVNTVGYSWLALFYTSCLLIAILAPAPAQRLLCAGWLMRLGTISYCTYLVHVPLILAGRRFLGLLLSPQVAWLPGGMLGMAATVAIATLSWRYFEEPLLRRGHRHRY